MEELKLMLDSKTSDTLLSLSTPLLGDARVSLKLPETHLDPGIRPVVPFTRMVGLAVPVLLEVARNESSADLSLLTEAYQSHQELTCPIIVIQVPVELHTHGIFGEGAATVARAGGFGGALIEGAVRDTHDLQRMEFPTFSRTVAPGYIVRKASAVASGEPVCVGGRTIHFDDIIFADNDGVIVIEPEKLNQVIARAQAIQEWEKQVKGWLAKGKGVKETIELVGLMP